MSNRAPTVVMSINPDPLTFLPLNTEPPTNYAELSNAPDHMMDDTAASDHGSSVHMSEEDDKTYRTSHALQHNHESQNRVQLACMRCRKQKLKCDGASPACSRCIKRGAECIYSTEPTGRKNGSKKKSSRREKKRVDEASTSGQSTHLTSLQGSQGGDLVLPSQRPPPQLAALEQLSRKLKMELDSYSTMAKHWQEQLQLLQNGGLGAVTDKSALTWLKREMKATPPKVPSGRPRYLPERRNAGESWSSYTSESHPSIHLAHAMKAFNDRSLLANPLATLQDPSQVDLRCHRFRLMRFWDMPNPADLLTEDLSYETISAAWDILLQPIRTVIQGNSFVDEIGRPLEDDLETTKSIDSIAIFAHTAELEEVLSVMEFGCLFFHATQLVGWEDQMQHLMTNVDRLLHVAFFQRSLSNVPELADRVIRFILWYVWRYKAFQMMSAYRSILSIGYQALLSNFDSISPTMAASINCLLVTTSSSHQQMLHHVHLAERIPHSPLKKALLAIAIAIVTLNRNDSQIHHYEKLEADYPELLRVVETVHNPFDPDNHALASTALFLHAEVLVRLGRDIRIVEQLITTAIHDVVTSQSCGAIHLLFSTMFLFQATINTVVQFSSGVTCTVSDFARIEMAKALGFPLGKCTNIHKQIDMEKEPCKLKFGADFAEAIGRISQFQPCNGTCQQSGETHECCKREGCPSSSSSMQADSHARVYHTPSSESVITPGSEYTQTNHWSPNSHQPQQQNQHQQRLTPQQTTTSPDSLPSPSSMSSSSTSLSNGHSLSSSSWSATTPTEPMIGRSGSTITTPTSVVDYESTSISASSTSYFVEEYTQHINLLQQEDAMGHHTIVSSSNSTLSASGTFYASDPTLYNTQPFNHYPLSMSGEQISPWDESFDAFHM